MTRPNGTGLAHAGHASNGLRLRNAASRQSRGAYEQAEGNRDLAQAFGVSSSAISHRKNGDHKDPVEQVCTAIMELRDDTAARALLAAVEAAYERRELLRAETPVLLNRFCELWHREHELDALEDRAAALWMGGASGELYDAAVRRCGTVLHLLAEIRDELEQRGVDVRAALIGGPR